MLPPHCFLLAPSGSRRAASLLLFVLVHCCCAAARHVQGGGDGVAISEADYQGLQAIKHGLFDLHGYLRSWNTTGLGGACSGAWTGINCVNGKVVAITLPWRGLGGSLSARGLGQLTSLRRLSLATTATM